MDKHARPTTPDAPTRAEVAAANGLETTFEVELEFSLKNQGLAVRSKASTIMLEAIILGAVGQVADLANDSLPENGVVVVNIAYDMLADHLVLKAAAPRMVVVGVLAHALGAITRNQTAQNFAVYKQAMEKRVADLEARAGVKKIILPGG